MTATATPAPHTRIADCAQIQTFDQIEQTLHRLDKHGERTALALEKIAEQGAMVASHEKRLDKHDIDLREVFSRVNDHTKYEKLEQEIKSMAARLSDVEVKLAKDEAAEEVEAKVEAKAEEVEAKREKFWTEVKLKLVTPILVGVFFALWLIDKLGIATAIHSLWKEFK